MIVKKVTVKWEPRVKTIIKSFFTIPCDVCVEACQ